MFYHNIAYTPYAITQVDMDEFVSHNSHCFLSPCVQTALARAYTVSQTK
jgi:hypothetical protein